MSMPASEIRPPAPVEAPTQVRNILVVDDDAAFRYLCVRAIDNQEHGAFRSIEAASAQEAIEAVMKRHIDCALIDYNLPDADGATLMREIRAAAPNWSGAMVVMTAGGSEIIATEAIRAGAVDYIPKGSISQVSLQRALTNAIEKVDLQNSIVESNSELARAYEQLQKRSDEIARFYHRVSHEIKTPLTAARMFMSMLHEGLAGELNDEQVTIVSQAIKSCDELSSHFDDLIECTRLETGKVVLHKDSESLQQVVGRAVASVTPAVDAKSLDLSVDLSEELPELSIDSGRIVQVIANVLGNAVKFTEPGGTLALRAQVSNKLKGFVEIAVSDSGIGIAPEDIENVFERLYQVSDVGDSLMGAGLGLGLTIAKEIVELHLGTIEVSSELGEGTTFTIYLPIDKAA